jgi:hypothetical protein
MAGFLSQGLAQHSLAPLLEPRRSALAAPHVHATNLHRPGLRPARALNLRFLMQPDPFRASGAPPHMGPHAGPLPHSRTQRDQDPCRGTGQDKGMPLPPAQCARPARAQPGHARTCVTSTSNRLGQTRMFLTLNLPAIPRGYARLTRGHTCSVTTAHAAAEKQAHSVLGTGPLRGSCLAAWLHPA